MTELAVSAFAPTALRSLTLATPNLRRSTSFYTDQYALTLDEEQPGRVALKAANGTVALELVQGTVGLIALCFVFQDAERLHTAMIEHERAGRDVERTQSGFALYDPAGLRLDFAHDRDFAAANAQVKPADRPIFLSHIVLNACDPCAAVAFYEAVIGLRATDRYERDLLTFLQADQPQHHCIGIAAADVDGLNHFAMDCGNIDAVMRGMMRFKNYGAEPLWGPGRHGPGGNIFCYFEDPDGFVAEYTCDVMQISDRDHRAQIWGRTPENGNVWLTGPPTARGVALMAGQLQAEFRS
jgi:catechol 2,3-dioxygenase-like lactoylglutathione lyase family enzyme